MIEGLDGIRRLAVNMARVEGELPKGTRAAARMSAHLAKELWQAGLEGSEVPAAASTIWWDVSGDAETVRAVIASTKGSDRLRGFTYAAEYGSPTVGPAGYANRALQRTGSDFERGLGIAGQNAFLRALDS